MQNLKKIWLVVWKVRWGIWQSFTRAFQSLKIGTLMGLFYAKLRIYWLRIYTGVIWQWRMIRKLKKNWLVSSKLTWRIWWVLIRALENLKNLPFNGLLLIKVYNVWVKKVQRSYIWWCWILMLNLKENWLLLSKVTWSIWEIFTRALENLNIGSLIGFFYPK